MDFDSLFALDDIIILDDLMFLTVESIAKDSDFAQSFLKELYKDVSFNWQPALIL